MTQLDCPYDFTSRCTMGRCDCKPKKVTIKKTKDSWNREEVVNLLKDLNDQINKTSGELGLCPNSMNDWIKQNL